MQRAAAAERHRDEFRRIVPALDRHQADRARHAGVGDAHDRGRGIVHCQAERALVGDCAKVPVRIGKRGVIEIVER